MKKIISISILAMICFLVISIEVSAKSNPYKQYHELFGGKTTNCTWNAWEQAKLRAGVELPGWGNADTWYDRAKKAGYSVGKTPKAKSIMVEAWDNYGHVSYVESVSGKTLNIWDVGGGCVISTPEYEECLKSIPSEEGDIECAKKAKRDACPRYYDENESSIIGFIYLDSVPKTTKKSTTTKKTTIKRTITKVDSESTTISSSAPVTSNTSTTIKEITTEISTELISTSEALPYLKEEKKVSNNSIIVLVIITVFLILLLYILKNIKKKTK